MDDEIGNGSSATGAKNIICDFDDNFPDANVLTQKENIDSIQLLELVNQETSSPDKFGVTTTVNRDDYDQLSDDDEDNDIIQNDTREINVRITTKSNQLAKKINKLKQVQLKNMNLQPNDIKKATHNIPTI